MSFIGRKRFENKEQRVGSASTVSAIFLGVTMEEFWINLNFGIYLAVFGVALIRNFNFNIILVGGIYLAPLIPLGLTPETADRFLLISFFNMSFGIHFHRHREKAGCDLRPSVFRPVIRPLATDWRGSDRPVLRCANDCNSGDSF
jgi:hypothetical protein